MKALLNYEFCRFLAIGLFNTFFGLLIIYLCKWFFDFNDVSANIIGYSLGIFVSFVLNSSLTFGYQGEKIGALAKFFAVSFIAYLLNLTIVLISINYLEFNSYVAQAMGIPPYTLTSFFASKYFVFRSRK